ncbi:VRR-NUC domain-containing protein [Endozoicomonas arenosclerae]|uniref:VRR-NUC domain-containing protein n=1 Tax=Endozoicomonas arenosclerae TaxID=1633495 RepID=UPI00078250A0|nr:VRR-NUC domain-containing protein [Endozoicomonas arenosclerae]
MTEVVEIPEDYYLINFQSLLDFVTQQYNDLLTEPEQGFLDLFKSASEQAQRLYVRLICRKGPLFRSDKLNYQEIENIASAARELEELTLLNIRTDIEISELASLATKPELLKWFSSTTQISSSRKRAELVEQLISEAPEMPSLPFEIYEPLFAEEVQRIQFLFFGNLHQDLTEFVLQDLGLNTFEKYSLPKGSRLFKTQDELNDALQLSHLNLLAYEAEYDKDSEALCDLQHDLPEQPTSPILNRRYSRLVNRIARELEREELFDDALALFERSSLPPARERMARIQHKLGAIKESEGVCENILANPASDMELEFARRFLKKLRNEKISRKKSAFSEQRLSLSETADRVELQVQNYYQQEGWTAFYVENNLICGLAGLLFWDILFADIPDAFVHPFQSAPADLLTPDFYRKRQTRFEQRFKELEKGELVQYALDTYEKKRGISNRLIHWPSLSRELIDAACRTIPWLHLKAIFEKLVFDFAHNRTGFPDLILFKPDILQYLWVEVKGPGDKLQENQKRWLSFFVEHDIPAEVIYVDWQ